MYRKKRDYQVKKKKVYRRSTQVNEITLIKVSLSKAHQCSPSNEFCVPVLDLFLSFYVCVCVCGLGWKKVRFADSLGLELITVKHFDDTDEPELDTKFPRAPAHSVFMELQFTNPGTLPGFEQKVREVKVMLECVQADEFSLSGFVRVLNLAFQKSVSLRYSLNNWITFMDSLASYVPSSCDGDTDKFCFKIVMPTSFDNGGTLQFAIKYCVKGKEYWDNNNGNNYKVRRHRYKMSPYLEVPYSRPFKNHAL
uniref:CBM21 domain-containing protein n=1 Tax=Labrus bergylta TaxID=56723 RepID=A0A3Q3L3X3_9LABR